MSDFFCDVVQVHSVALELRPVIQVLLRFVDLRFWSGADRLPRLAVISHDAGGCNTVLSSSGDLDGCSTVHGSHWYLVSRMHNCRASGPTCSLPSQQPSTPGNLIIETIVSWFFLYCLHTISGIFRKGGPRVEREGREGFFPSHCGWDLNFSIFCVKMAFWCTLEC